MSPLLRFFLFDKELLLLLPVGELASVLGLGVLTKTPLVGGLVVGQCGRARIV
jgi:hypothetical protein